MAAGRDVAQPALLLAGVTLTLLQLALKFAGLAYIPAFTKIYQVTLDWFPGFVFMLASVLTVAGMIPVR